jgi:hypothetical protein
MGIAIRNVVVVLFIFGVRTQQLFFHFSGTSRTAHASDSHVILTIDLFFSFPPDAS